MAKVLREKTPMLKFPQNSKPEQNFTKTDLVLLTTSEAAADGIEDIACTLFPTMTRPLLSDVVVLLL